MKRLIRQQRDKHPFRRVLKEEWIYTFETFSECVDPYLVQVDGGIFTEIERITIPINQGVQFNIRDQIQ